MEEKIGICHICGNYGPLTFEHVPPESAFNNKPVMKANFEEIIKNENERFDPLGEMTRGSISQRGAGGYTLCGKCNSITGHWYGGAYLDWTFQGLRLRGFAKIAPSLSYRFQIFPLRVIKQIVCMFFSANGPYFQGNNQQLVKFILNRNEKYIQQNIKIYIAYNLTNKIKQSGVMAKANLSPDMSPNIFSEITFPPWIYLMTLNSSPPDKRLIDISYFSRFGYNDWKDIVLQIPILPINTWIPADYRKRDEVLSNYLKNLAYKKNHPEIS